MTTEHSASWAGGAPLVLPFPVPGEMVRLAYRELHIAMNGTPEQQRALGNHALLPKPWEPATCLHPGLRAQVWQWLDEVVIWLNHQYTWDVAGLIPNCWPLHPHVVHEVAVLADQRRRAALAKTSDALEEWHRYSLPAFTDRTRDRLRAHCDDEHTDWPGRPRHNEHLTDVLSRRRQRAFASDIQMLESNQPQPQDETPHRPTRLGLVDLDTGEIHDDGPAGADPRTRTPKGPRA